MEMMATTKIKYTKNMLKKKSVLVEGNGNGNGQQQLWMDEGQQMATTTTDYNRNNGQ